MENFIVTFTPEDIQKGLDIAAQELFKNSYSNPIKKLVEAAVDEKSSELRKVVDSIITEAITNPEFKTQMTNAVMSKIVEAAIRK